MFKARVIKLASISLLALVMAGCATHHDRRANNTLMGAGLGAAAGAVVSGGDVGYTIGGAAAGGLLGNILTSDDRRHSRKWDNNGRSRHSAKGRHDRRSHSRNHRHRR